MTGRLLDAKGMLPQLGKLIARCAAFGLEIEVRVRKR